MPVSSSRGFTYVPSTSPGSACGTPAQPWIVDAEPGQHLDVSVIDFAGSEAVDGSEFPCPGYLLDRETPGGRRRNVSLCSGSGPGGRQRERDVYQSIGHVIELITYTGDLQATSPDQQAATFLVRFEGQYCMCI